MKWLLPPIFVLASAVAIVILFFLTATSNIILWPYNLLGIPLTIAGLAIAYAGRRHFEREETNIMTFDDPDLLITDGLFRYSRNPMYLGFLLLLAGAALTFNNYYGLILPTLFFLTSQFWYIPFEEQKMIDQFGDDYCRYCQQTRRWI